MEGMKPWFDIEIPNTIINRNAVSQDWVNYSADGHKQAQAACYASHMTKLSEMLFECEPLEATSPLPGQLFMEWFAICKQAGLCPENAEPHTENNRNYLKIDGRGNSRHIMYAALCCYRWAENLAPMPYTVVELLRLNPQLSFWQVLHYAMGKFVTITNHSFCSVCVQTARAGIYGQKDQKGQWHLPYGLSVAWFFSKQNHRHAAEAIKDNRWTNETINNLMTNLGFPAPDNAMSVNSLSSLLWPEFTPLYENPEPNRAAIAGVIQQVKTKAVDMQPTLG